MRGTTTLCLTDQRFNRGRFNPNDSPLCVDINTLGLFKPALIPAEAQSPVFFLIRRGLSPLEPTSQVIEPFRLSEVVFLVPRADISD